MDQDSTIYRCGALRDAEGCVCRPGLVLVRTGRIVLAGPPEAFDREQRRAGRRVDLSDRLVMPVMVNGHAHLQLSAMGPRPYGGTFTGWVGEVMREGPRTPDAVEAAVGQGVRHSWKAGVSFVADIAGAAAMAARRTHPLAGVSFLEWFDLGARTAEAVAGLREQFQALMKAGDGAACRLGIQPHAPYSAGAAVYQAALDLAPPGGLSTHLAETPEELTFIRQAAGPFADLLRALGKWDDSLRGHDQHPVDWMAGFLQPRPHGRLDPASPSHWVLAHCNYVEDEHLPLLAGRNVTVAYCPVASDYFGHRGHRYRAMIEAGVNVCLGTDSILCQPAGEAQPLGILPQMRHLFRRDQTDPDLLLRMALGGSSASLAPSRPALSPEAPADLIAVRFDPADPADPLAQVLASRYPVERLAVAAGTHQEP